MNPNGGEVRYDVTRYSLLDVHFNYVYPYGKGAADMSECNQVVLSAVVNENTVLGIYS